MVNHDGFGVKRWLKMTDVLLIFDFNNLLYKGMAIHPLLEFAGKSTGGFYGMLSQMCHHINNHQPNSILICSDGHPYFRKDVYPQYKEDRQTKEPEFYQAVGENKESCLEFFEKLNIPFWQEVGFEADDLIATICERLYEQFDKIIVVSNDDDLFQLFKFPGVCLQRSKVLYTRKDFKKDHYNTTIKQFIQAKALAGGHNGVKGFKGIGMATALKIVKDKKRFKKFLETNMAEYMLYKKLTELPYPDKSVDSIPQLPPTTYNEGRMVRFLAQHGIEFKPYMKKALENL